MKKRVLTALSFAVIAAAVLSGCTAEKGKGEKKVGKNDEKTFVVGLDASFPPFGYKGKDGSFEGFDLDLAREVCKRNGWTFKAQPIDWDSKDMELSSGTIDCIWNGFTIDGREDKYTFSKPYIDNSQVVVVPEDSGISGLKDLAGKLVEVQADSSALRTLEDGGERAELAKTFGALNQSPDYNTAFMDLEAGACEAVAMDAGVAKYQIDKRGGGYVILEEKLSTEQYAVGFKLGNEKLRDKVQKTLDEMAEDGTLMEIAKKWSEQGVSPDAVCLGR